MDIKLAVIAFAIHIVFFVSIFDIYFTSPLVHGMTPHSTKLPPPAKRLVLFVTDGLRANKLFSLDGNGQTGAPYLRGIIENTGSWGISHTRVPTESRPGHVALIGGFYEDVSAVSKGWKENPVEFDSVFNESRYTWSWGNIEILNIFIKEAQVDHVFAHAYGSEEVDYAEALPSKMDTWVFDKFEAFLDGSRGDPKLASRLQEDKIVLFLYLIGLDTTGHSYKPHSQEYRENIRLVDEGVERMVELIEGYYQRDGRTAYVLSSDHGMTDWGSHGSSHPDETLTPLLAWGAGINKPRPPHTNNYQDNFSEEWGLSHLQRSDVHQADIAPLMASLIGVPYPLNSVGTLPIAYLDNSPEFQAESLFTNVRQVMAQFEVKEEHKQRTTLTIFFRPFKPLTDGRSLKLISEIKLLLEAKAFNNSITKSHEAIRAALDGMDYYQTYDRLFLAASVTLGYLGWMGYLLFQLIHYHTALTPGNHGNGQPPSSISTTLIFASIGIIVSALLFVQSSPPMYYVYCLLPVPLWHAICQRYKTFSTAYGTINRDYGISTVLVMLGLCIAGVEILVLSLFYREVVSIGLVAIATWPLMSSMRKDHLVVSLGWFLSCLLLAIFPLMPVVGKDVSLPLIIAAGSCILLAGAICFQQLPGHDRSWVLLAQLAALAMATLVAYLSRSSIERGGSLPAANKLISWSVLVASFFVPSLVTTAMLPRLLSVGLSFSAVYILMSTSHEGFFYLMLCVVMLHWLICEQKSSRTASHLKLWNISFSDAINLDKGPSRKLELVDVRCAFFFVFFILTAFFGTGNIASINSFDPSSVYCFLTVYNSIVMGSLLLWKIAILFILVTCTFQAIHVVLRVPTSSLFLVVLLMSDCMALQFFFLVRDSGSWLEIGTSISHYVIVMCIILFLNLLLVLAKFFTAFTFPPMRGKTHSL